MKSSKFLFFASLVSMSLVFSPFNALARTQTDEDIFSIEKVQQWGKEALDEIDKKEVLPDKNTAGVDLDTSSWGNAIHPFEFLQSPKTTLIYKTCTP